MIRNPMRQFRKFFRLTMLIFLLTAAGRSVARTWKLDYELRGVVVAFELKDYLVFTDRHSLEHMLTADGVLRADDTALFARISDKLRLRSTDTIRLACWELMGWDSDVDDDDEPGFREFNQTEYAKTLYPQDLIIMLAEAKKLRIFDKVRRRAVRSIHAKDSGSHKSGDLRVAYLDPATGREIFAAVHYLHLGNPKF